MKRIVIAAAIVLAAAGAAVTTTASAASAAPAGPGVVLHPVITFDDVAHQVTLTIPTTPCPAAMPECIWKFFLNEPKLSVDVTTVYSEPGASGTLTIPYPDAFCGVIQADAYIGGPPWVPQRGFQHTISDCTSTPVTPPSPPSNTPVTPAPIVPAATTPPPASPPADAATVTPSAAPVVAATSAQPVTTATAPPATPAHVAPVATQLPFTGLDVEPLLFIGMGLVLLGLYLMLGRRSTTD